MLDEIRAHLARLSAGEIDVGLDDEFEPTAGTLLRVRRASAYWHLPPEQFLALLEELEDGAGPDKVHQAIERHASFVWHGPSPKGSRDTP